jgi:hypothetical protein
MEFYNLKNDYCKLHLFVETNYGFDSVSIPDFLLQKFAGDYLTSAEMIIAGIIHEASQDRVHLYTEGVEYISKWFPGLNESSVNVILNDLLLKNVIETELNDFGQSGYRISQCHLSPKSEVLA